LAKGAMAVALASYVGLALWGLVLAAAAVVIGHIWPAQLGFRGGKGMATALGALLVLDYQLAIVLLAFTGIMLALARRFTLSGLVVVNLSPAVAFIMGHPITSVLGTAALARIILIAHRTNVIDLLESIHHRLEIRKLS